MKKIREIMSTEVHVVSPEASLKDVAIKMNEVDSGAIPVCDGKQVLGIVTDRDIVIRTLAENRDPNALCARDVMSSPIIYCFEDENTSEASHLMESKQIRRLIVLDQDKNLVGIVSLGDIAVKSGSEQLSGEILEKVSEPTRGQAA